MSKAAREIFEAIKHAPVVWTTGVGKSASVADLLARYLRNIGVPAAFLDATDYWHGGRGGVMENHLLVAVSASGKTDEMARLVDDCACQVVHVGKEPMAEADMHWMIHGYQTARVVSVDPIQTARAIYDLVCEYADYVGVTRHEAAENHPANGVACGAV